MMLTSYKNLRTRVKLIGIQGLVKSELGCKEVEHNFPDNVIADKPTNNAINTASY